MKKFNAEKKYFLIIYRIFNLAILDILNNGL